MEFSHVGRHCEYNGCKQLDFLPFNCAGCHHTHCLDHRTYDAHKCPKKPAEEGVISCPLCEKPLCAANRNDINAIVDKHITEGCKTQPNRVLSHKCSRKGCKKSELIDIRCKECRSSFCITHRSPLDHDCRPMKKPEVHQTLGPFRVPIKAR
ncbi:AN1-type zinc finger protein [Planoprotostelium fungivorum]|uniref:AN1-type zinc finger protein n=1 Tax=Planoprotostelium fungivorum TaxID=1890364 RepID=A0A2P6NR88_9EUKA|nr:AN1-type zinc finger protein [Planoprotostelium fungivorum]